MSEASVITNEDGDVKLGYSNNMSRPKFAIMNPCRTFTLPPYQTAAGVTDMMMHTMERYFTIDDDMDLTTDLAEAVLRCMKVAIFDVLKNPEDYRQRAQIMWGGSVAHNGLTGCGVSDDWATHQLEHELSGMFDVTHGAGLAAIWPSWARYVMHQNLRRFVRFAVNVMDVPNDFTDPEGTALKGIEAMERFYHAINMRLSEGADLFRHGCNLSHGTRLKISDYPIFPLSRHTVFVYQICILLSKHIESVH